MEPEFRFCTSSDGTRIAYAIHGNGPPLLYATNMAASMDELFTLPEARSFLDALAEWTTLVMFDQRGGGASTRDVDDVSPEADAQDIAAVADAAGLGEFTIFAMVTAAACARYAIDHPERVQQLVLWFPFVGEGHSDLGRRVREADWSYGRRLWASLVYPNGPVPLQRALSSSIKKTVSAEMAARRFELPKADMEGLLPSVTAPTLVLQRETRFRQDAMRAAGLLPSSQLRFVAGDDLTVYPGHEPIVEATVEFMGLTKKAGASLDESLPSGAVHTILFTDVEGSTALTERLGDAKARDLLREHERIVRRALKTHGGSEVKTLGDGFMTSFSSATKALECAIAIQQAFAQHNVPAEEAIRVRIGLNAGEPIAEDDPGGRGDLFGTAVNMAARIAAKAEGGEILASNVVRELVAGKGFLFNDRGETELRGFEDPVRVYEVSWRESS